MSSAIACDSLGVRPVTTANGYGDLVILRCVIKVTVRLPADRLNSQNPGVVTPPQLISQGLPARDLRV